MAQHSLQSLCGDCLVHFLKSLAVYGGLIVLDLLAEPLREGLGFIILGDGEKGGDTGGGELGLAGGGGGSQIGPGVAKYITCGRPSVGCNRNSSGTIVVAAE